MIAFINPRKRGCGFIGLDKNSGCACVAIINGCDGISTISTKELSGDVHDIMNPFFSMSSRYLLLNSYL